MAADPNTFDYWEGGENHPDKKGESSTTGFDYWEGGEMFSTMIVVSAGTPTKTDAGFFFP